MAAMETPRVSCSYLNSYVNRNVLVVGKVVQLRGESAIVDADGHITVNLNREAHLVGGNAAQIVGKVMPDLSIKVLSAQDLGVDVGKHPNLEHQLQMMDRYPLEHPANLTNL